MSDNPGDGELSPFFLQIELDERAFAEQLDAVRSRIDDFAQEAIRALMAGDEAAADLVNKLRELAEQTEINQRLDTISNTQIKQGIEDLKTLDGVIDKLVADYGRLNDASTAAATNIGSAYNKGEFVNERAAGYGVSGGMIGPAGAGDAESGGSPPGLYGLARGARGLGVLAGNSQAGQGVASLLYVTQAFEQLEDVLGPINESLIATGGLFPPLTEGLVGLGVPMAGLVGVILPLTAAFAAVAAVATLFNNEIRESEKQLQAALSSYHVYIDAIANGTTKELEAKLATATGAKGSADTEVQTLSKQVADGLASAFKEGGGLGVALLQQTQGWKDLTKQLDDAKTAAAKAAAEVSGLNQALSDPKVKANDAADAALKAAQDKAELDKQFAADNKLSTQAVLDNQKAIKDDIEARKASNVTLEAGKTAAEAAGASVERIQAFTDAINANNDAITAEEARYNNLREVSFGLANAREEETRYAKLQAEITKEHVQFLEQENKLRQTGTPDQYGSAVLGIQSKRAGAQAELDALQAAGYKTSEQADRAEELTRIIEEYNNQLAELDTNIKPVVDARAAMEDMTKAADDFAKKQKTLQDQLQVQSDTARAKELQAEQQYTIGSIQDVEARLKIRTDESRKEVQLAQDTANRKADISIQLTNQENQLTKDFGRQQEDDITKANEQQSKLIREARYQAREDEIAHVSRLREIRTADRTDEQRALLDRNFLKLFEDRQAKTKAIQDENDSYAEREAKLSRHLQDQENELAISLANEQKQQRIAYQRKFEDMQQRAAQEEIQLQLNEERKRSVMRQAEQDQLSDLTTNENYKIRLLQSNLQNELDLYGQQELQRVAIAKATQDAIIAYSTAQLQAAFGANPGAVGSTGASVIGGGGSTSYMYADGGNFNANSGFVMSEEAPEALRFGSKGYNVNGAAMVYPLQSGSVTPVGSGGSKVFAPTINLNGTLADPITPERVRDIVYDAWEDMTSDNG